MKADPDHGGRLFAILENLSKEDGLSDNLNMDGFRTNDFDVKYLRSFIQHKVYAYRLKVFEETSKQGHKSYPIKYRVIYAVDCARNAIHVLAIMPREVNYEQDEKFCEELVRRYKSL